MTKGELINAVAKAAKTSKRAAEDAVNATFANLGKAIKKTKRMQVPGFGTFSVRLRKARIGRNPQTGAVASVPRHTEPSDFPRKTCQDLGIALPI